MNWLDSSNYQLRPVFSFTKKHELAGWLLSWASSVFLSLITRKQAWAMVSGKLAFRCGYGWRWLNVSKGFGEWCGVQWVKSSSKLEVIWMYYFHPGRFDSFSMLLSIFSLILSGCLTFTRTCLLPSVCFLSIFFSISHFPPRILTFIICISTRLDRVRVILIKDADDERSEMQWVKTICNLEFFSGFPLFTVVYWPSSTYSPLS